MFYLDLDSFIINQYVLDLVVQYFCQWLYHDNLSKLRTYYEPNQTTLKYKNLFSLTSKILGSSKRVFTD